MPIKLKVRVCTRDTLLEAVVGKLEYCKLAESLPEDFDCPTTIQSTSVDVGFE